MERRQPELLTRRDLLKWGVGGGVLLVSGGAILAACEAAGASPTATTPAGTTPAGTTATPCAYSIPSAKVVLGNYPVFDLGAWVAAEHWGYLKDLNLTLEHKVFPDERTGLSALAAGTSQLQLMGDLSLVGIAPTFPDFRNAFTPEIFMGFAPLIRPNGPLKTFDQMKQEVSDPAAAKQKTCAQIQGKKWLLQLGGSHETILDAVLECADSGLTRKDVNIVDIGPAEGATAFLRGEGDLYLGDVPNRYRLEEEGMVPLITAFDLGQKAEDYIAIVANLPWIQKQENEDTLMRLMAAWYRAVDDLRAGGSKADDGWQTIAEWVNKGAGTSFDKKAAEYVLSTISPPVSLDDMTKTFYTPGQPQYLPDRLVFGVKVRVEQGHIKPGEVDPTKLDLSQQLFAKYLAYKKQAEDGIAAGGPNVQAAQQFLSQRNFLDAVRVLTCS